MSRFDVMIGRARIKSTQKQIRISYKGKTIKLIKRKVKAFFIKLAIFVICLHILGQILDKAWEKIDYQLDVLSMNKEQCHQVAELLTAHNLNAEPDKDGKWCNDYSKIESLSKNNIYGFYHFCGYGETENVLKTLGYTSWNNFLVREGYYDASGSPSFEVWENYAESNLVEEQREALENGRRH